jgi:hypothetical protein
MRMDAAEFHREMEKAIAEVDHLDGKNVDINVKADTARAEAGLARVSAESDKVNKSSKDAGQGMGALVAAIVAVGPAVVPIAAASAGLAAGFGAMGAAGILALVGIKQEMAAGTTVGRTYTAQVNALEGNLHTLARTAATGVLSPFESVVKSLQKDMPTLNRMTGEFSVITGKTAGNITTGLVAAFVALRPLMQDVSVYTLGLSQRFEHLMTGQGVVAFGSYIQSVFPQVMGTVESLVGAAVHLAQALAPLGMGTLSELRLLSDVISALPVDVLSTLATVASAAYLGFKGYQLISGWVEGLGSALRFLGASEEVAASGMAALNVAAGGIGTVIAVATLLFSQNANAARDNQQAVDDYTQALRQSNGVIDENVRQTAFKKLQDEGAIDAANRLGISLALVTDAALGNVGASREVAKQMAATAAAQNTWSAGGATAGKNAAAVTGNISKLSEALGTNTGQFKDAQQNQKDWAAASKESAFTIATQDAAQRSLATGLGATATALQAAQTAQKQTADQTAATTVQMQLQNDAAGLLKQALDALNGKAISAADAQNAFDSSLVNMGTHMTATGGKVKNTSHSIYDMTAGSVALRGELNAQVKNLQAVVEANGGLQGSTAKSRAQMATLRQEIINNAVAHGVDRDAVTRYIDKLLAIPKKIPPTKLDVDTTAALVKLHVMQSAINSLTGKTVSIYTDNYITTHAGAVGNAATTANRYAQGNAYSTTRAPATGQKPAARAHGGDIPGYAGGTLIGPGSGTSDSIMAMVAQTQQLVRLSTGEFISTDASRRRNRAALEAGNRGAQLEVAGSGGAGVDYDLLAAAVARAMSAVVLRPTISATSVDRAMGSLRR